MTTSSDFLNDSATFKKIALLLMVLQKRPLMTECRISDVRFALAR